MVGIEPDAPFYFDAADHSYLDAKTGEVLPSITQLLKLAGLVEDKFYTEDSRFRGTAVHDMALHYDLGALTLADCSSPHKNYFAGYVAAMERVKPSWTHLEEAFYSPRHRFGGRPDRVGLVYGCTSVLELKSGQAAPWHAIQTALQAILVAPTVKLLPVHIGRYVCRVQKDGRYVVDHYKDKGDIAVANRIIAAHCWKG